MSLAYNNYSKVRGIPNFCIGCLRNINPFTYTIDCRRADLDFVKSSHALFLCASVALQALSPYTPFSSQNVRLQIARHKRRGEVFTLAAFLCLEERL